MSSRHSLARSLLAALVGSIVLSLAGEAGADWFDDTFRHWGDSDHLGTVSGMGQSVLHTADDTSYGAFVALHGKGVAYSYAPSKPKSFRFATDGSLGITTTGEETSFDGEIAGEAMLGYRIDVPELDGDKRWPRSELFARAGFGFHVLGNHLLYSSALELPRFEVGFRHEGWYGGRWGEHYFDRDSYIVELRAVASFIPTGRYLLEAYRREANMAPAFGAQLDLVGQRPDIYLGYLRELSELSAPIDRIEARTCIKFGPKDWSRHEYAFCARWRLRYAVDEEAGLEALSGQTGVSFGFTG